MAQEEAGRIKERPNGSLSATTFTKLPTEAPIINAMSPETTVIAPPREPGLQARLTTIDAGLGQVLLASTDLGIQECTRSSNRRYPEKNIQSQGNHSVPSPIVTQSVELMGVELMGPISTQYVKLRSPLF